MFEWIPLIAVSALVACLRFGSQAKEWALETATGLLGEVLEAHGTKTLFNGQSARQGRPMIGLRRRQARREKLFKGLRP